MTEVRGDRAPRVLGKNLPSPAVQHRASLDAELRRPRRTPPIHDLGDGIKVFAGQRLDGFYVDLGSVFDLAALRPFQNLHLIPTPGRGRRQRAALVQRAHDRDPGADHVGLTRNGIGSDRSRCRATR